VKLSKLKKKSAATQLLVRAPASTGNLASIMLLLLLRSDI